MNQFLSVDDVSDPMALAKKAIDIKAKPFADQDIGVNKVLGMLFFNSSLRTRMSTARAAFNLGMRVISLNVGQDSWQLEMEDGTVMDQGKAEHVKDAAGVMSSYCDLLAVRSFPTLKDRSQDYSDETIRSFVKYAGIPIINMESATLHPLQSLADLMTIMEEGLRKPKVVLTWAPHVKALPQSVANSFAQWMLAAGIDLTVAQPEGMELSEEFTKGARVTTDQDAAFQDADIIYVKNWSSYHRYGQVLNDPSWMITQTKMNLTHGGKLMHCLPVRRNVVISDDAMDSASSIMQRQAENRIYSAQAVIKELLEK